MRKMIGVAVALVVVLAVLRRFGPALKDHGMAKCQEIFESLSTPERALDEEPENLVPAICGVMTMMWGGGWWVFGAVVMVVCIFLMGRMMMGHGGSEHADNREPNHRGDTRTATEVLAERFARGEISQEEFEQRKRVLEGSSH